LYPASPGDGVNISGTVHHIDGDIIGRDKIVGLDEENWSPCWRREEFSERPTMPASSDG
jgi:hypothetical protein